MITKTMDFEYCNTCIKMVNKIDWVCLQCKTMDWEEYIKKSDVLSILTKVSPRSHMPNVIDAVMELPTINLSVIDELIKEKKHEPVSYIRALKELKQRLSITK